MQDAKEAQKAETSDDVDWDQQLAFFARMTDEEFEQYDRRMNGGYLDYDERYSGKPYDSARSD